MIVVLLASNTLLATEVSNPFAKSWTHVNGNSAVLELLNIQGDQVTFLKPDGTSWTMPISNLVPGDQGVARQMAANRISAVTRLKAKDWVLVSMHQDIDLDAVQAQFSKLKEENPNLYSRLNELAEFPMEDYELDVNDEGTVYLQFLLKPGVSADSDVEAELASFLNPDPLNEVPFKLSQIEQESVEGMDSPSDLNANDESVQAQSVIDTDDSPMPDDENENPEMAVPDIAPPSPEIETYDSELENSMPTIESSSVSSPLPSAIDCVVQAGPVCATSVCDSAVVYGCCEAANCCPTMNCCPTTTCCETTTCCTTECCSSSCTSVAGCCDTPRLFNRSRRSGILRRLFDRLANCGGGCR